MSEVMEKPKAEKKVLKKWKITFHSGEGEDDSDVMLAHNYRANLYKRNVETVIDENYLAVLKDAVVHTVLKSESGKEMAISIPRYSYTLGEQVA